MFADTNPPENSIEALEKQILTQAAYLNAANFKFLRLLAEFDEAEGWGGTGIKFLAHWLNWKVGLNCVVAREKVRVARALKDLPEISRAFEQGEISYSKVRAMTRVATPLNEDALMMIARHGTAAHVELLVRKYQKCKSLEDDEPMAAWKKETSVTWYQDELDMTVIHARLSAEDGAVVVKTLEVLCDRLNRQSTEADTAALNVSAGTSFESEKRPDFLTNRATALVQMAKSAATADGANEKYHIMLHVNANARAPDHQINGSDACYVEDGHFIDQNTARRIACDASLSILLEDDNGAVLNIGRRSRIVPRNIAIALAQRDKGCVFPGCCQQKYTDAHHIHHWADGGETRLDNLLTLCRHHHGLIHKGAFKLKKDGVDVIFSDSKGERMRRSIYPQFPLLDQRAGEATLPADLELDDQTAACLWQGETMDVQMAISGLYELE